MDETLLDAFVGIKPDPNFLDAINTAADQAIAAFTQKFSTARIPLPNLGGGSGASGGIAESLRAAEQAVQGLNQRREAGLARLAALEREIAAVQRPSRSQFTPSGEERSQRELANIALQRTRIEQELADLLNANRPLTDLSDQAAIQNQILDTSEERVQVERELARIIDQRRVAESEQARFTGPFRSKFTDEFISTRTTDEDRQAAIAGQESYNRRRTEGAQAAAAAINAAEEGIAARRLRLVEIERDAIITADALAKRRIDLGNQLAEITSREAAAAERVQRIREGIGPAEEQRAARLTSAQEEQLQIQQQMVTVDQQLNDLEQQRLELIRQQATAQGELRIQPAQQQPSTPGSGSAALEDQLRSSQEQIDILVQRRSQSVSRIADLDREISSAQSSVTASQQTQVDETLVRNQQELADLSQQRIIIERDLANLIDANSSVSDLTDQAAIQKQILSNSEQRIQVERELSSLIESRAEAEREQARFTGPFRSKFTDEFIASRSTDEDRQAAIAGQESYNRRRAEGAAAAAASITSADEAIAVSRRRLAEIESESLTAAEALVNRRVSLANQIAEISAREADAEERIQQSISKVSGDQQQNAARLSSAIEERLRLQQQMVTVDQQLNELEHQRLELIRQQATAQSEFNDRQQNPPPVPPAPPEDPPAGSGGGGRRRRRGGSGGGSNDGGGDPAPDDGDNLAARYRAAADAAQDLLRDTQLTRKEAKAIGAEGFDVRIDRAAQGIRDIQVELRRAGRILSEEVVTQLETDLERFNNELRSIQTQAAGQGQIRQQFNEQAELGKNQITTGRIETKLQASLVRGLPSAEIRKEIAIAAETVEKMEAEVRRLSTAFDGSVGSVQNLRAAVQGLAAAQTTLKDTYQTAQQTSQSMNTLTNNAYQLGQAFEDFSVGYSLNGFAGGIRGAANNVAFLLNDMSRLEAVQKALPRGWANQLPLIAGIGSALAIVVLPKVIEWLESLNDIEAQFKDISQEIQESFEDADFRIKFRVDNDEFRRSLDAATSVRDILEEIRDINFGVESKRKQLLEIFSGLNDLELFDDQNSPLGKIEEQLRLIDSAVKEQLKRTQNQVDLQNDNIATKAARNLGANTFRLFGAETFETELSKLKGFSQEVFNVQRAIQNVVDAGNAGIANPDLLVRAQRQVTQFSEFLQKNVGRVDISGDAKKSAEAISASLDVFNAKLKEAEAIARQVSNEAGEKLSVAIQQAILKTDELADRQIILRKAIDGSVSSQAEFLLDVKETSAAYVKLIDEVAKAYRSQGRDPSQLVGQLQAQEIFASENVVLAEQKETIDKIRDAEKRLSELRERNSDKEKSRKSQFTDFEAFSRNLQTNVLSIEPIDKNTDAIEELTRTLIELNFELAQQQATAENLKSQFSDPQGFSERQRSIAFARPFDEAQALQQIFDMTGLMSGVTEASNRMRAQAVVPNEIADAVQRGVRDAMQGLAVPIVGAQNATTEAVKKIDARPRAQ